MTRSVLVTGSTGTVGRHVVRELDRRGVRVEAATRDPAAAADRADVEGEAVTFVEFDFSRPETWGRALVGVDGVFLVRPPGVAVADLTGFVDAAGRVGVSRLAYLSTLGADRNVLLPHHRIERHVRASGIDYVFLRASFFAQNLHEVHARDVIERDEVFVPAGRGRTSFVDARDVGAVGAVVLTEPGHRDVAYDLTGPAAIGYEAVAATLSRVLDRDVTYPDPSVPAFVRRMRSRGYPLGFVLPMVGIYTTARLGLAGRVTEDVERLLGRPPRGIEAYVADYADHFRPPRDDDGRPAHTVSGSSRVSPADPPPECIVRIVNPLLVRLLRSPLHRLASDHLLLLTVTGRRSGLRYTFPVGYERSGDTVYVTSHGTNWWRNLRDGGQRVRVVLRGTERVGHATVVEENRAVAEYIREYLERHGVGTARRVGLEVQDGGVPDERALEGAVDHVVVVEIDLDDR